MLLTIQAFLVAFGFSYIGSIPPGTINITVIQFALLGEKRHAIHVALAAALVEFFYGGIAVAFHWLFLSQIEFTQAFKIVAGLAMIGLGIFNVIKKPVSRQKPGFKSYEGLKKGLIISIFNPLAIPFWIAVTAYLESLHWVIINKYTFLFYIIGISTGTFLLLMSFIYLVTIFKWQLKNHNLVNRVIGILFLLLGLYTFFTLWKS